MQRFVRRACALVLPIGLAVASAGGVLAQADGVDQPPARAPADPDWANEGRNLTHIISFSEGLTFTSTRTSALAADRISGQWDLDDGRIDLLYDDQTADAAGPGISLFFLALVEYRDLNGDGTFGLFDEVVHRTPLTGTHKARIQPAQFLPGDSIHPIVDYPIAPAGRLRFNFHVLAQPSDLGGAEFTSPTSFPFEFSITQYPFQASDTALALETRARMNDTVSTTRTVESALALRRGDHVLDYTWKEEAFVDGEPAPVGLTVLEAPNQLPGSPYSREAIVVFSYPQGLAIQHGGGLELALRPTLPAPLEELKGDWRVFIMGLGAAAVIVAYVTWRRLRPTPDSAHEGS